MSQVIFPDIDPASTSGTELAALLNDFKDAVISGMIGTSRPSELLAGGSWIDNTNEATPNFYWSYKVYTGTVDVEVFRINVVTGVSSISGADSTFEISRVSADAVGPIARFVKNRIASSGQVLAGDIVGELRFIGKASDASSPVVAKMKVVAIDNETNVASGVYYVWETTPALSTVAVEHMRLMNGLLGVGTSAPDSVIHARGATGIKSAYGADSANAAKIILEKERLAGTKATQNGDAIGQLDVNTTDDASAKNTSFRMQCVATQAHTSAAQGTKMVISAAKTGTATVTERMSIGDVIEDTARTKINMLDLGEQDVATAATIAQLSATKVLVEMTGSTATDIQGIDSTAADRTKVIVVHNRSSANVTLKHQNGTAAAADRLKLPSSSDVTILPDGTVMLQYCATDSRWKLTAGGGTTHASSTVLTTYNGIGGTFLAPSGVTQVKVTAVKAPSFSESDAVAGGNSASALHADPGSRHMIDAFGNMYAWGTQANGQLGDGSVTTRTSPVLTLGGFSFTDVVAATPALGGQVLGLSTNGSLYAWGANANGQLGLGDVVPRSSPVIVLGGLKYSKVRAWANTPDSTSLGITTQGQMYAWGTNAKGQLGLGDLLPRSSPVLVLGGLSWGDVQLAEDTGGTNAYCLGLTPAGVAYAWGANTDGNLGVGNTVARSSPVLVLGGLTFQSLKVNFGASYGLTTAGALYGWGINSNGQLGVGNVVSRSSPVAVLGGLVFQSFVASANASVLGLTTAGALYAWGINTKGVLGVGDSVARSSPVLVLGGLTFQSYMLDGNTSAFAISTDSDLYAWGTNANGQLGLGDVVARSSPVIVLGGLKWAGVTHDASGTIFGVTTTGSVYCWGLNTNGGDGTSTPRSSPVLVLGGLAANIVPKTIVQNVTVVPGNSYTVSLLQFAAMFGNSIVGMGNFTAVQVEYAQ